MFEGTGLSIRIKTTAILIVSFMALMVVFSLVLHFVVTPEFEDLELREVHDNVDRLVKELEDNAFELRSRVHDWGEWDDTWEYMEGQNPSYLADNLNPKSISALAVDLVVIIDTGGRMVFSRGVDPFFGEEVPVKPQILRAIERSKVWETFRALNSRQGIMLAGDEPLLFAASRILKSDGDGQDAGTILFGRIVNAEFLKNAGTKLNASVSVKRWDEAEASARTGRSPRTVHGVTIYTNPVDESLVSGWATISDWEGKPSILVEARSEREVYSRGVNAIIQAVIALTLLGIVFMAVSILIVDKVALSRLSDMREAIEASRGEAVDFGDRSGDEIAVLASTIETAFREKAQRERELAANEKRKELALAGAELGFWEYDIETGSVFFSDRFAAMLGYEAGELEGSLGALENLIHPEDRRMAMEGLGSVISMASPFWDMEYRLLHKDGSLKNVHSRGRIVDFGADGRPKLVSGTHMDVTDRVRAREQKEKLEEKLRAAEKLRAVGTLAGGVAHNFNNILAAIMGYAELIQEDLEKGSQPYRNISEILDASARASDLVRQLLVFSQEGESATETVDVRKLVVEVFRFMREVIPTAIEMVYRIPATPLMVKCDSHAVRQALINVCSNSREAFEGDRGRIVVTVTAREKYAESWSDEPLDVAMITIEDDGEGMEAGVAARAFDPYFTTKGDADRLGLGLALAHGAVSEAGGTISLESAPGEGTTVTIVLPATIGGELKPSSGHEAIAGRESILFVDDESLLVDIARQHFGKLGYRLTAKTSPREALELFRADPLSFDAVVTDFTMPEMSGFDLAVKIREVSPDVTIFLCSGYIDVVSDEAREKVRIAEVFRKPLFFDEMLRVIRVRLDEAAAQRSAS